jgi:hypothetical protein
MRKIIANLFISLDGVVDEPGKRRYPPELREAAVRMCSRPSRSLASGSG